jgi:hypothetical protein
MYIIYFMHVVIDFFYKKDYLLVSVYVIIYINNKMVENLQIPP